MEDPMENPTLPLFTQMNVRTEEGEKSGQFHWTETSRWVKFQEDVDEDSKRWSKPYVPALQLSALYDLRHALEDGIIGLNVEGSHRNEIIDHLAQMHREDLQKPSKVLEDKDFEEVKSILQERVKLRMKLNLKDRFGKKISLHESHHSNGHQQHQNLQHSDSVDDQQQQSEAKSSPTDQRLRRLRAHNQFMKKVPKGSESCMIFVASVNFVARPIAIFMRFKHAFLMEAFAEVEAPTRFACIILGPFGSEVKMNLIGRALGTLMCDQIFPLVAYRAKNLLHILDGLDTYMHEVTVLAPSVWDPSTRLEPPKKLPSIHQRLTNLREHQHSSSNLARNNSFNSGVQFNLANEQRQSSYNNILDDVSLNLFHSKSDKSFGEGGDDEDAHKKMAGKQDKGRHGKDDDTLKYTGKIFGGLILDIKRKLPWYLSDFKDGLNIQSVATIIYIYLATITKAITFGGFLGDITDGQQGVLESFLGHALVGGIFCLFGGQPLTVVGCTGPVLIFEKIMVEFCASYKMDYMTMRLWIGLWASLFCVIIVAVDASAAIRYITRFTEESFAALIGIIFIAESLKKLYKMSKKYKVHAGYDPEHMTYFEEGCHCDPPDLMTHIDVDNITATHPEAIMQLNASMNGTLSLDHVYDIPWDHVTLHQCTIFGGHLNGHNCPYVPDIFFFSFILFCGTYLAASVLKKFKTTRYFPAKVRSLISDYGVIIAITAFVCLDQAFQLHTPKLLVPTEFKPTRSDIRGWIIPFTHPSLDWYIYIIAFIPALLLTILLFMDQQITSVIVNRSEHKLKKGCGYHLDMLIIGIMVGICSVIGLPWCVAATVLCLGHVDSLKMETETSAPGETPQFLGIREQRVTGTMVFLLTGLSVKLAPALAYIPMPVLYGVLLYMGVASLRGMQFIDRCELFFMPPKHQPDYIYLRHVTLNRVYLFTFIQIMGLVLLWIIKSTPVSLVFPLMVIALVGIRKLMDFFPKVFSQKDLFWLDNVMPDSRKAKEKKKRRQQKQQSKAKDVVDEEDQRPELVITTPNDANDDDDDDIDDEEDERKLATQALLVKRMSYSEASGRQAPALQLAEMRGNQEDDDDEVDEEDEDEEQQQVTAP